MRTPTSRKLRGRDSYVPRLRAAVFLQYGVTRCDDLRPGMESSFQVTPAQLALLTVPGKEEENLENLEEFGRGPGLCEKLPVR